MPGAFRRRRTEMGLVMKRKILALGLFSLCCVALFVGDAAAWFGPLNPYRPCCFWNCRHRYATQITCRPYNAFTPICWGNLVCDGCCPNPCGVASGCLPMTMGAPPWAGCGTPYMAGGFAPNFPHAADAPYMGAPPGQPMPDIRSTP